MLASFLFGEFLLHIPCWLHFYLGSFSYTSHAGFIFIWRVSLTHPMLQRASLTHPMLPFFFFFFFFLSFFFLSFFLFFFLNLGSFSYTSRAGFIFIWGVSLTHPVLASILSADFLLHITCWLHFYRGSLSYPCRAGFFFLFVFYLGSLFYTSHADFVFMWGVSLTHPVLPSFLCGEFLLHIPSCFDFYAWSFSYTAHACSFFLTQPMLALLLFFFSFFLFFFFFFIQGIFLTPPVLVSFSVFLLFFYQGCFSYTSRAAFIFIWGVSLTHPMLALILSGVFLLNIPCWLHFYQGSFSYNPVLTSFFMLFLSVEFLLHIPYLLYFSLGSFSYTFRASFIFIWGVSLTHPVLASFFFFFFLFFWGLSLTYPVPVLFLSGKFFCFTLPMLTLFLCGEFLLHIPCCLHFYARSFSYTSRAVLIFMHGVSLTQPMLALFFNIIVFIYISREFF